MKKLFLIVVFSLELAHAYSQNVIQTSTGDYIDVSTIPAYVDSITGHIYTSNDVVYTVYKGKRGGIYIWKTSKSGNKYKKYLSVTEKGYPANLNEIYYTIEDL